MRGLARWLSIALWLIASAAAFGLAVFLGHKGVDWASKFSEVASFALALAGAVIPIARGALHWPHLRPISSDEIEADIAALAAGLSKQWERQRSLRRLESDQASTMRLRWEMPTEKDNPSGRFEDVLLAFSLARKHRLLILGPSGAGKSTLAQELARQLVDNRQPGDRVPIILPVARWNPSAKLPDWIAEQLERDHPRLAKRGRDESGDTVTHAQLLLSLSRVIPILDSLDEMPAPLRPAAVAQINSYGAHKPLVVASRANEYEDAVRLNRGRPIEGAAELRLCRLSAADIKDFLVPFQGHDWSRVFERLDNEVDGPLANALGNPLTLALAKAAYVDRSPDELADRYRFDSRAAIEGHLLRRFVRAVYTSPPYRDAEDQFRYTAENAQRWLGFLAGEFDHPYWGWRDRARHGVLAVEFAWWNFGRAARSWRLLGVVLRSLLLASVIVALARWVLTEHGDWGHGWSAGFTRLDSQLLAGPLGRFTRPTVDQLLPPRHGALVIGWVTGGFILAAEFLNSMPYRPVRLQFRPFKVMRAVVADAVVLPLVVGVAMAWRVASEPHHMPISTFIGSRSTLIALLAVPLIMLPTQSVTFLEAIDLRGAVSPMQSLRLDRQADIVITIFRRSAVAVVLGLWAGAQVALAYAIFAVVSIPTALLFGGQLGFASRRYTDACLWLACRRRLPRRAIAFMADAEIRGVLRAVGASYEFRHIRVEQQLHDWWGSSRFDWRSIRQEKLRDLIQRLRGSEQSGIGLNETANEYRALIERNPYAFDLFGPKLVTVLNDLASKLWALGQRDDAIDAISEQVGLYRQLVKRDPGKFRPKLAQTLTGLGVHLSVLQRVQEFLGVTREAVEMWYELATEDSTFEIDLARPLAILASDLKNLKDQRDGVQLLKVAVQCYSQVTPRYAAFRPWLAIARVHLACALQRLGQSSEYETVMDEALYMYGKLAEEKLEHDETCCELERIDPVAYRPPKELDTDQWLDLYLDEEAKAKTLDAANRAITTYRTLARTKSGAFLRDLEQSLDFLTGQLFHIITWDERRAASRESLDIWHIYLSPYGGTRYLWGNSGAYCLINDVALPLWKSGRLQDALTIIGIAREVGDAYWLSINYRSRAAEWTRTANRYRWRKFLAERGWPDTIGNSDWRRSCAEALNIAGGYLDDHAFQLQVDGRETEAGAAIKRSVETYRKVVKIYRELSDSHPDRFLADLAKTLETLAAQLRKTNDPRHKREAQDASAEADAIRRSLALPVDAVPDI
jgi:hypothetical protein